MGPIDAGPPPLEGLADLTPTFSVAVLYLHPEADPTIAFRSLCVFLRDKLQEQGQARSVQCLAEVELSESDQIEGLGSMPELGVDGLFASLRERRTVPSWAAEHSDREDVKNQLTLVLRIGPFAFVHTPVSGVALRKWLGKYTNLYRYLPAKVLRGVFIGDGRQVWLRGVHRRRVTKADSKTIAGLRIQEALDDDEDASYALTAATINLTPTDADAFVRGRVTVSPGKSRIYWRSQVDLFTFLTAAVEMVEILAKAITTEPQEELFRQLAIPETDLGNVRGAYDVTVAELDEVFVAPDADLEDLTSRVDLLRDCFLEVRDVPNSPDFVAVVGHAGAEVAELMIKPVPDGDRFELKVGFCRDPWDQKPALEIRDAISEGDLLTVHYESGHTFEQGQINMQRQTAPPFPRLRFADFGNFLVTREKPPVRGDQAIHDAIAGAGDISLFAWVVRRYRTGWLVCDDHAGEVADFLHLANNGSLTAIHVKGAFSKSPSRQVAVGAYQEVVAQAVKNLRLLDSDLLAERFVAHRELRRAAWFDGRRVTDFTGFTDQLQSRTARDTTSVLIVQPHLREDVHDAARKAAEDGAPTRDSHSLTLLDGLLRSARRAVTNLWDDVTVLGSE